MGGAQVGKEPLRGLLSHGTQTLGWQWPCHAGDQHARTHARTSTTSRESRERSSLKRALADTFAGSTCEYASDRVRVRVRVFAK
jgi:hypothetical protein